MEDPDSIYNTYRFLLNLRKTDSENIIFGEIEFVNLDDQESYVYINHGLDKDYLVVANFRDYEINLDLSVPELDRYHHFYGDKFDLKSKLQLKPYQTAVFVRNKDL
jgi:glycosidase